MVIRFGLFILLLCLSLNVFARGFTAQVDRLTVGMGDHIQLVLSLEGVQGSRPDVSALDTDFTILQKSQSSSVKVTNGVVTQEVKWVFLLSPNRKGVLTIPSFTAGNFKSESIDIEVGDAPVNQSTSDDVLLEVEVKPLNPYVKGQVVYTQRLYFARSLVNDASLDKPKLDKGEAEITFLGSSNPRRVKHNGRSYQMIERYYSIFPTSAGELLFSPSVFRGSVDAGGQQSNFNRFMFNTGKRVTAYSSKASLVVSEPPAAFTGSTWLPSSQLSIDMTWSQPPETLKAGEPVTVTIMLMAEGLKAEILPEVKLSWPNSLKTYPEKPEFRTDKRANGLVGLRQEKVVLVANQNGEFIIPPVEVPWWNTVTNQQEVARLSSTVVRVSGAVVSQPLAATISAIPEEVEEAEASEDNVVLEEGPTIIESVEAYYEQNKQYALIVLALLFATLVLIVGAFLYVTRATKQDDKKYQVLAKAKLAKACRDNDAMASIKALPEWASAVGIFPATLAGIEEHGDIALATEVSLLAKVCYSQGTQLWEGNQLLDAVNQFSHANKVENVSESLASLHPSY